jgi:hypothetical protein
MEKSKEIAKAASCYPTTNYTLPVAGSTGSQLVAWQVDESVRSHTSRDSIQLSSCVIVRPLPPGALLSLIRTVEYSSAPGANVLVTMRILGYVRTLPGADCTS